MTRMLMCLIVCNPWLFACGGELGDGYEQEFETEEQDVRSDPEMGFRTDVSGSDTRCLATPISAQSCVLPPDKSTTVRVTGTNMSASQKADVETRVDSSISFWTDNSAGARDIPAMWTLQRVTSNADVNIEFGTLPGTNKNNIHTYARLSTVPLIPLDDLGATGNWSQYGAMTCKIDNVKITADFTLAQRPRVRHHAIDHCITAALGVGAGGGVTRPYAVSVTPDAFKVTNWANKPRCWLSNFVAGGTQYQPFVPALCASETDN